MTETETQLREDLVAAYSRLAKMGLMGMASGNLSCRVDGGMLISCSGATAQNLTPDRVVKVWDGNSWEGEVKPSSEWQMHLGIYQSCDSTNAVVHTHSDYCVAVACNNTPLPGFHYMVGMLGGPDVPCVPYSTFGSCELAADAGQALKTRAAVLLGNHGMISHGASFDAAIGHAELLETLCRHYVLARQLGEPELLTETQWDAFFAAAKTAGYGYIA